MTLTNAHHVSICQNVAIRCQNAAIRCQNAAIRCQNAAIRCQNAAIRRPQRNNGQGDRPLSTDLGRDSPRTSPQPMGPGKVRLP